MKTPHLDNIPYVLMKHESKSQLDAKLKQLEKEGNLDFPALSPMGCSQ